MPKNYDMEETRPFEAEPPEPEKPGTIPELSEFEQTQEAIEKYFQKTEYPPEILQARQMDIGLSQVQEKYAIKYPDIRKDATSDINRWLVRVLHGMTWDFVAKGSTCSQAIRNTMKTIKLTWQGEKPERVIQARPLQQPEYEKLTILFDFIEEDLEEYGASQLE